MRAVIEGFGTGLLDEDQIFYPDSGSIPLEVTDEHVYSLEGFGSPVVQGGTLAKNASDCFSARVCVGDRVRYKIPESILLGTVLPQPADASEIRKSIYLFIRWDGISEPKWELKSNLELSY